MNGCGAGLRNVDQFVKKTLRITSTNLEVIQEQVDQVARQARGHAKKVRFTSLRRDRTDELGYDHAHTPTIIAEKFRVGHTMELIIQTASKQEVVSDHPLPIIRASRNAYEGDDEYGYGDIDDEDGGYWQPRVRRQGQRKLKSVRATTYSPDWVYAQVLLHLKESDWKPGDRFVNPVTGKSAPLDLTAPELADLLGGQ